MAVERQVLVVSYDHGHFFLAASAEVADEDLFDRAIDDGVASGPGIVLIATPGQSNFEVEIVLEPDDADDLDQWDEAFEASIDVSDDGLWWGSSPDGAEARFNVAPGRYRVLVTGKGFSGVGYVDDPQDEWRIRIAPVSGPIAARRLKAWQPGPTSAPGSRKKLNAVHFWVTMLERPSAEQAAVYEAIVRRYDGMSLPAKMILEWPQDVFGVMLPRAGDADQFALDLAELPVYELGPAEFY
jgi:hypothetical protein